MGEIHPKYKDLCENMNNRMFDLMKIFRDGLYADPKFKGSYSIKKVLPVLVSDLSYDGMEIAEGATAMGLVGMRWYISLERMNLIKKAKFERIYLGIVSWIRWRW